MSTTATGVVVNYPKRRNIELVLVLFAQALAYAGYLITQLNRDGNLPAEWLMAGILWFGAGLITHFGVRFLAPYADPLILPSILLLNGLGLAMIQRIDLAYQFNYPDKQFHIGRSQLIFTLVSAVFFVAVLFIKDHRRFQRFPYLLFIAGITLLLLPLVPGLGVPAEDSNGAQVWIHLGSYSFQPGEIAKIVLAIAFASYLEEHKDVLALAGGRFAGIDLPRPRDLGPIAIMWVAAVIVLVFETDLGMSLLFFGLFVVMLYVATQRTGWVILGVSMFSVAGVTAFFLFRHVKRRFNAWLTPFDDLDANRQIIQGQFGIDWGGISGRGWGLGQPIRTSFSNSDMIFSALQEELGLAGALAIVVLYCFIVARGLRAALTSHEPFGKLLATGLTFAFGLQVFLIIGGVTRLLPLTGLTTPFMSAGGTALVANWILMAMLIIISHQARKPTLAPQSVDFDLGSEATQVIQLRPSRDRGRFPESQSTPTSQPTPVSRPTPDETRQEGDPAAKTMAVPRGLSGARAVPSDDGVVRPARAHANPYESNPYETPQPKFRAKNQLDEPTQRHNPYEPDVEQGSSSSAVSGNPYESSPYQPGRRGQR